MNTRCSMGVGCDEAGVCYADAHGQPDQCPHYRGHIPGPWQVGEVRHAGAFQLVTAGDRGYVCEVRCGYLGNCLDHDRREATARLIAAAPDLLEALQSVFDADGCFKPGAVAPFCGLAKAAIAKALAHPIKDRHHA